MLQDSENGFSLQFGVEMRRNFGASMDNNGGEEERRKATWKERKKLLKFAEGRERRVGLFIKKN